MNPLETPPVWRHRAATAWRAIEIPAIVAWHFAEWIASLAAPWRPSETRDWRPRLASLLEALGPTFIKAGQVLSARPDLIARPLASALARLRENVVPVPERDARATVEQAFGRSVREIFTAWNPVPVATGSVAQVHRAVMADGRVVAVKIRRPGIERQVRSDFALLHAFAAAVERLPGMASVPMRELVQEVAQPITEQLDFLAEADNNCRLRDIFAGAERLRIPALVPELCARDVITMEFIHDLQTLSASRLTRREREDAALIGLRALYRMIFVEGFVHADMHPGNVFVRSWGEVVMLDTGLVARLTSADRHAFVDFFFGLVNDRGRDCARILVEGASRLGHRFDRANFDRDICDLVARYARLRSCQFEIAAFVGELIAIQRRHHVRGSTAFMTIVLAMVVFDGICKQLYPGCDFQKEARPFLVIARYEPARTREAIA